MLLPSFVTRSCISGVVPIAISTIHSDGGEYAWALRAAGASPHTLAFDLSAIERQLATIAGVVLSGGDDVDPRWYGARSDRAEDVSDERDSFELALVRRARECGVPTLCICRGMQLANVAFGGTLWPDIGDAFGVATGTRHRVIVDGQAVRGVHADHAVEIAPDSCLASSSVRIGS